MKFRSLSALLALSAVSLSYAGGMIDAPKMDAAAKSPVMTVGYKSFKLNLNDSASDYADPSALTGYTVGLTVPVVGPWSTGVHYSGYSSNTQDITVDGSVVGSATGVTSSLGYHVGYDLPFAVMDNVAFTGKLIAEDHSQQLTSKDAAGVELGRDTQSVFAVGFGLTGQYFMDTFGLELGLSYLNPQGVSVGASNYFTWNVSLAYKLA